MPISLSILFTVFHLVEEFMTPQELFCLLGRTKNKYEFIQELRKYRDTRLGIIQNLEGDLPKP